MAVHYYPLVNKFMTSLNLRQNLVEKYANGHDKKFVKPFITVAREPGSGGAPIAKAVADKIGFTFVDEQIIDQIASSTRKRRKVIKDVDEKARGRINDIVQSVLNEEYVDDITYMRELTKIVLAYALQGHVVILGRGANFITPLAQGLHVNIIAPHKVRVQRAMDFEGHTEAKAKQIIREVTKERENFVKQYLSKDIKKRTEYDVTLNTNHYDVDCARDVIIEAFYRKFSRTVRYGALFK